MVNLFRFARCALAVGALMLAAAGPRATPLAAAEDMARSSGQTVYVPVYSHVFFGDRGASFNLATTLSIRNADPGQALSVTAADYYDATGRLLKKHVERPVVLKPLASTEIFIPESDTSGGFGASFIVRWQSATPIVPPIVECLMIGARSGQGISFVSRGRVVQAAPPQPLMPEKPAKED
jgi:hypothetical protein